MNTLSKVALTLSAGLISHAVYASPVVMSTDVQDEFFDNIRQYCGQSFEGEVVEDNFNGIETFSENRLLMHVRKCEENRLEIPFHVGDNHSRTWILTKTGSGISLKHDHRKANGDEDIEGGTMYGGHTQDAGWANAQSFPADQTSKEDFIRRQTPQSVGNTWHMFIYPGEFFGYRLTRPGREMRVDFDLSNPVDTPPTPWGYEDN